MILFVYYIFFRKIQEEGLRTWIFTCRNHYDSISLDQLAKMFDLPVADVHSIICRMIIKEELSASIDESASIVVMSKSEENKLHLLAQQYYEKVKKKITKYLMNNIKIGFKVKRTIDINFYLYF